MTDPDPLFEWNRLANENTKHAVVSAMYFGMLKRSPQIEVFVNWLLAASGASAALLIANLKVATASLTSKGFSFCIYALVVSASCGVLAKCTTVFFPTGGDDQQSLRDKLGLIFNAHNEEREKIIKSAVDRGLAAPPDMEMAAVLSEFLRPMPFWAKWLLFLYGRKKSGEHHGDLHIAVRAFMWQCDLCFLQAFSYITFLVLIAVYAKSI